MTGHDYAHERLGVLLSVSFLGLANADLVGERYRGGVNDIYIQIGVIDLALDVVDNRI